MTRYRACVVVLVVAVIGMGIGASLTRDSEPPLRLNDLQVIGTHNSYHVAPSGFVFDLRARLDPSLENLKYSHPSLERQLSTQGVRQLELDVWADPSGTLWSPSGTKGFKVFHSPGLDTGSNCPVLVDCLHELKEWSRAHPYHLPIAVMVEPRDVTSAIGAPTPVPITTAVLDTLDVEIRSVMHPRDLVTPDDVRGSAPTLEAAVRHGGWPTLAATRGKFLFMLVTRRNVYREGHPSLEHRVMFTPSRPGQPDAAFVKVDDPLGANEARIQSLVRRGYLVRTRADEAVVTPKSGAVSQREAALASGAQWVSTDYPVAGQAKEWDSDYVVQIPGGGIARCNPVLQPKGCTRSALSESAPVAPSPRLPWLRAPRR